LRRGDSRLAGRTSQRQRLDTGRHVPESAVSDAVKVHRDPLYHRGRTRRLLDALFIVAAAEGRGVEEAANGHSGLAPLKAAGPLSEAAGDTDVPPRRCGAGRPASGVASKDGVDLG